MSWHYWDADYVTILKPGTIMLSNYNYFISQHCEILHSDQTKCVNYVIVTIVAALKGTGILDTTQKTNFQACMHGDVVKCSVMLIYFTF